MIDAEVYLREQVNEVVRARFKFEFEHGKRPATIACNPDFVLRLADGAYTNRSGAYRIDPSATSTNETLCGIPIVRDRSVATWELRK